MARRLLHKLAILKSRLDVNCRYKSLGDLRECKGVHYVRK